MDRHEAYKLLIEVLSEFAGRPFRELEQMIGRPVVQRVAIGSGEEFLINVAVTWIDGECRQLRVAASVDSPSTFKLERIEEHRLVSEQPPNKRLEPTGLSSVLARHGRRAGGSSAGR